MAVNLHCNLISVTRSAAKCGKPAFAGTGDYIYVFDVDAVESDLATKGKEIPTPTGGQYSAAELFEALQYKCYRIDIKSDSGQVTSEMSEGSDFRSLTGTAIVDHNIDKFLAIDRAIAGSKVGVLIPDNTEKGFHVILSPFGKRVKYSSNYDSGTTYDSDHGFTITFTLAPVYSACPRVSFIGVEADGSESYSIDQLLVSNYTGTPHPERP